MNEIVETRKNLKCLRLAELHYMAREPCRRSILLKQTELGYLVDVKEMTGEIACKKYVKCLELVL
jgi:hypothetical protein